MQIQMTRHWQGANGHVIKPAIYEANDPALLNMAAYLVENGYAIALEAPKSETVTEVSETKGGFVVPKEQEELLKENIVVDLSRPKPKSKR